MSHVKKSNPSNHPPCPEIFWCNPPCYQTGPVVPGRPLSKIIPSPKIMIPPNKKTKKKQRNFIFFGTWPLKELLACREGPYLKLSFISKLFGCCTKIFPLGNSQADRMPVMLMTSWVCFVTLSQKLSRVGLPPESLNRRGAVGAFRRWRFFILDDSQGRRFSFDTSSS